MQNLPGQKSCTRCRTSKIFAEFPRRKASADGHNSACRVCVNAHKRTVYLVDDAHRAKTKARTAQNKKARFQLSPAYKRAFYLWSSTKKRSRIPPWVKITDFERVCQEAIDKGPDYELDHVIPMKGKLVCGLHVPTNIRVVLRKTNHAKSNKFLV